jgi:glutamate racemase
MHAQDPIGIFDSGLGGLTVAKTIATQMPLEPMIYFGDTAHVPWGDKSVQAIQRYALKISEVLLEHRCKAIVIACHTASANAFEIVKDFVGDRALVLNVIDPIVQHIQKQHAHKKIGLIGTKQTVRSNLYQKAIDALDQDTTLASLATPLLVPFIEEGLAESTLLTPIIEHYLSQPSLDKIEALILGCTHYPLIKKHIQAFYKKSIDLIDASELTAAALQEQLLQKHCLNTEQTAMASRTFYLSDYNDFFAHSANRFFSEAIAIEHYPLWD